MIIQCYTKNVYGVNNMFTIEKNKNGYFATFTCSNNLVSRYPSFDTLRDLHIYMTHITHGKYNHSISGNVHFDF